MSPSDWLSIVLIVSGLFGILVLQDEATRLVAAIAFGWGLGKLRIGRAQSE
jgi:hypothetical protein